MRRRLTLAMQAVCSLRRSTVPGTQTGGLSSPQLTLKCPCVCVCACTQIEVLGAVDSKAGPTGPKLPAPDPKLQPPVSRPIRWQKSRCLNALRARALRDFVLLWPGSIASSFSEKLHTCGPGPLCCTSCHPFNRSSLLSGLAWTCDSHSARTAGA